MMSGLEKVNHYLYHYVLRPEFFGSSSHKDDVRSLPKLGRDFGCDRFSRQTCPHQTVNHKMPLFQLVERSIKTSSP
jgi:hypothetical protein